MASQPYLLNGKIIQVPEGHTPPAGALPLTGQAQAGGIDGSGFAAAAAQSGGTNQTTIPVWRDRNLNNDGKYNPGSSTSHTGSANAAEHALETGGGSNSSANALENSLTSPGSPKQMNQDQAVLQFASILQSPDLFKSWAKIALDAGLINPDQMTDAVALGQAWKQAVEWSINFKDASNGTVDLTPFEAAKQVAANTGSAIAARQAYAAAHFTGDRTTTQSTVSDQPADVQTLHDLLGRDPNPGELAAYRHGVSAVARANPTKTTTTTHYQDGKATSQDNVVTGGFDARQAEIDAAYGATPEVAANQQATTYYDALVAALRSAV